MLADCGPTGLSSLPVLRNIDLLARNKSCDAETSDGVIPNNFAVLPLRALERVNAALADPSLWRGSGIPPESVW